MTQREFVQSLINEPNKACYWGITVEPDFEINPDEPILFRRYYNYHHKHQIGYALILTQQNRELFLYSCPLDSIGYPKWNRVTALAESPLDRGLREIVDDVLAPRYSPSEIRITDWSSLTEDDKVAVFCIKKYNSEKQESVCRHFEFFRVPKNLPDNLIDSYLNQYSLFADSSTICIGVYSADIRTYLVQYYPGPYDIAFRTINLDLPVDFPIKLLGDYISDQTAPYQDTVEVDDIQIKAEKHSA